MAGERSTPDAVGALIEGYRGCALVYVAVRLDLPELMGSSAWTAAELASRMSGLPGPLHRLLRGLASIGVCEEMTGGRFALTSGGRALRAEADSGLREKALLAVEHYWPAWTGLGRCVESEGTAFAQLFGTSAWDYRREHDELNNTFNAWLAKETAAQSADIVAAIDIGDARRVADIGGGNGGLLIPLLTTHPHLTGVLFDQPHVIRPQQGMRSDLPLEWVEGDFLASVPVEADLYLLKSVIHDWDDEAARRILRHCRAAMAAGSRLLLIERVLPRMATEGPGEILLDLHMMAVTGGRERTLLELRELLEAERFAVSGVVHCASGHTIIEGTPA